MPSDHIVTEGIVRQSTDNPLSPAGDCALSHPTSAQIHAPDLNVNSQVRELPSSQPAGVLFVCRCCGERKPGPARCNPNVCQECDDLDLTGQRGGVEFHVGGPVLVRVCAWCQAVMGFKAAPELKATALSHGCCEQCLERMTDAG